jgi:CRP/FNR family cyclic AMP-dependent transcriptional regulator
MNEEIQTIEARVTAHPFLSGIPTKHVRVLAGCAKHLGFKSGEIIFRAGEPANGFYLLESGGVAIEAKGKKKPIIIDQLAPGEPLGWSWIFEPPRWHYDARATAPTTALFFDAGVLRKHRSDDETFGHELFQRMSEVMVRRLQAARGKLVDALEE